MRFEVQSESDLPKVERGGSKPKPNGKGAEDFRLHLADFEGSPNPLAPEAFHGLAGEIVRIIEPESEADPAALLIQLLVGIGNLIGRSPYCRVGADFHYPNLFAVLVGPSSKGRKGSAWSVVLALLRLSDEPWVKSCIAHGLSSGEGLITRVRDATEGQEPIREPKTKKIIDYQPIITDQGVSDKRLCVVEGEFASVLRVLQRDGNTLSPILRTAWDNTGSLQTLTKTPLRATNPQISIIGHVTKDELLKYLTDSEAGNGLANRFLWPWVERSKLLPDGGAAIDFVPMLRRLNEAVSFARTVGEIARDAAAGEMWQDVYKDLTANKPGLFGAVTSRAEAQVLRLSLIYALLDRSRVVGVRHLAAALAVWKYCEDSARFIFGDALGDGPADTLLRALRIAADGLTREQINVEVFGRNKKAAEITRALGVLSRLGLAWCQQEDTGGIRPRERWFDSSVWRQTS